MIYDKTYQMRENGIVVASEKLPHIAISVDMLDTGIDVPEVLNLRSCIHKRFSNVWK